VGQQPTQAPIDGCAGLQSFPKASLAGSQWQPGALQLELGDKLDCERFKLN